MICTRVSGGATIQNPAVRGFPLGCTPRDVVLYGGELPRLPIGAKRSGQLLSRSSSPTFSILPNPFPQKTRTQAKSGGSGVGGGVFNDLAASLGAASSLAGANFGGTPRQPPQIDQPSPLHDMSNAFSACAHSCRGVG